MNLLLLSVLASPSATASEEMTISEAVENGFDVVLYIDAGETSCETFSVDAEGNRSATYRTVVSVEEVLAWPAAHDGEPLLAGESIELLWSDYEVGPLWSDEGMGCQTPHFGLVEGARRPVVVRDAAAGWTVDPFYADDTGTAVGGDGERPPCGEAEQDAIIADLLGSEDTGLEAEDRAGDAPKSSTGCAVTRGAGVAPLAGLFAFLGLASRRRRA
jgi:hypothetical protein